ncbi:MAG: uracil-DNA glycosylase [Lentisphaeria bacterium]|nr:uracil-DNA glycosylase [Lentisphaeria bacterium]
MQESSRPAAPEVPAAVVSAAGMDWTALQDAVANCRNCGLCQARNHTVFGEGNIHAELMFIGEGPGADEDAAGRPFVGRAGQLLTKMIAAMTYTWEEVYIANVVKCRPPGNRNPAPEEAMACLGYLKQQIALIRPKVIVCLGGVALSFLCQQAGGITRARGHWLDFEGIPVMPTFHPAFLLRQESAKKEVWSDLQQVMRALGRTRK